MTSDLRCVLVVGLVLGALLGAASSGVADVVYLKNGGRLEGRVSQDAETGIYTVETGTGTVRLRPDEVHRVESRTAPIDQFESRWEKLPPGEIEPLFDLAVWAREHALRKPLERVCGKILELDPNDAMARETLGYVVFENVWVLEKDLRKKQGLVKFHDEWMTAEERERRLEDDSRKEVDDLLRRVASSNPTIQRFAVRELMAIRGPHTRKILAEHIDDPREIVRMVAAAALTNFPAAGPRREDDPEGTEIARRLYAMILSDRGADELRSLYLVLRHFHPREGFRLGLETLRASKSAAHHHRARQVVLQTLRKTWVPELCWALVTEESPSGAGTGSRRVEHPAVRETLRAALGVSNAEVQAMGFDPGAWLRWWRAHSHRFEDAP